MIKSVSMKPEDLQKAPKLFCENVKVGFSPEFFVIGMSSGAQSHIFSLTPQHTKRLHQYLAHELTQYEKINGEIKADWNPHVVSPVQKLNPPSEMS
jgi:hypothetical protein